MATVIQADYEQLGDIATRFGKHSEATSQTMQQLSKGMELLQGSWQGEGSTAFLSEMQSEVLPATQRLIAALGEAQSVTTRISETLRQAEEEAKELFRSDSSSFGPFSSDSAESSDSSSDSTPTPAPAPTDPPPDDRPDLNKEFDDFQVPAPDPNGITTVPPDWIADLFGLEKRKVTAKEAEMLNNLSLYDQYKLYQIQKEARRVAEEWSKNQGLEDGIGDAYRHAFWNAMMAREFGPDWAQEYSNAHEALDGNPKTKAFMDLWNNNLGIEIAKANPNASPQELAKLIADALENGQGVIIDPLTQRPLYSDQVQGIDGFPLPTTDGY